MLFSYCIGSCQSFAGWHKIIKALAGVSQKGARYFRRLPVLSKYFRRLGSNIFKLFICDDDFIRPHLSALIASYCHRRHSVIFRCLCWSCL